MSHHYFSPEIQDDDHFSLLSEIDKFNKITGLYFDASPFRSTKKNTLSSNIKNKINDLPENNILNSSSTNTKEEQSYSLTAKCIFNHNEQNLLEFIEPEFIKHIAKLFSKKKISRKVYKRYPHSCLKLGFIFSTALLEYLIETDGIQEESINTIVINIYGGIYGFYQYNVGYQYQPKLSKNLLSEQEHYYTQQLWRHHLCLTGFHTILLEKKYIEIFPKKFNFPKPDEILNGNVRILYPKRSIKENQLLWKLENQKTIAESNSQKQTMYCNRKEQHSSVTTTHTKNIFSIPSNILLPNESFYLQSHLLSIQLKIKLYQNCKSLKHPLYLKKSSCRLLYPPQQKRKYKQHTLIAFKTKSAAILEELLTDHVTYEVFEGEIIVFNTGHSLSQSSFQNMPKKINPFSREPALKAHIMRNRLVEDIRDVYKSSPEKPLWEKINELLHCPITGELLTRPILSKNGQTIQFQGTQEAYDKENHQNFRNLLIRELAEKLTIIPEPQKLSVKTPELKV